MQVFRVDALDEEREAAQRAPVAERDLQAREPWLDSLERSRQRRAGGRSGGDRPVRTRRVRVRGSGDGVFRRLASRKWRLRRLLPTGLALVMLAALPSYVTTMLRPSNSSFFIRTVEWARDHGGAGLVSDVEGIYYSLTAPKKGGPPLHALPAVGVRGRLAGHPKLVYRPPPVAPIVHPALANEGIWRSTGPRVGGTPPVLVTTFRPDPSYPRLVARVGWIDATRTHLSLYPGRAVPPSGGPPGPFEVPPARRAGLLATFNSGFKLQDSGGGFVAGSHVYAPLERGKATLLSYRDGRVDIVRWEGPPRPGPAVVVARQNLPLVVDAGRPSPTLNDGGQWGATVGNAIRVWRSGIGVDRHGNLIYAAANDQTVSSLAAILIHAGAVRAMELDINSYWVTFLTYAKAGGQRPTDLLGNPNHTPQRYLTPDDRDFFAVSAAG